jgi:hypothetical protein
MSTRMSEDFIAARAAQVRTDYELANAGRAFARPSALRSLLHRIAAR